MNPTRNWKVAIAGIAAVAVAGAGGAIAATKLLTPGERSQAIVNDAAKQLGVDPAKLSGALKKALENQVDADVAAGRITKEQGDAIKKRIESGDYPIFGLGGRGGFGHHAPFGAKLDAAAAYLGLTEAQLRTQLESGKSLADVAKAQSKSVSGLVDALLAAAKTKIADAVKNGRLTQADADDLLNGLRDRITDVVNGVHPQREGFRFRGGEHFRGPAAYPPTFGGAPA
ncbi:MAG TPA: hypothetical protein VGJ77_15370 [Gaiellaceae bacterium]